MSDAETRRRLLKWAAAFGVVIAWYWGWGVVDAYYRDHHDIFDPTQGTHMGLDAVRFDYGLKYAIVSLIPPLAIGLWGAIRHRLVVAFVLTGVIVAGVSTVAFYALGAGNCDALGVGPGQDAHFLFLSGAAVLAPALVGLVVALRKRYVFGVSLTVALSAAVVGGFLAFLQAGQCSSFSVKVNRESLAAGWFALYLVAAWLATSLVALLTRQVRGIEGGMDAERERSSTP